MDLSRDLLQTFPMIEGSEDFELRTYPPFLPEDRAQISAFLASRALAWDEDSDYSVALFRGERMIGVGSLAGRVVKGLAVDESRSGEGLAVRILSELEAEAGRRGITRPFVFTGPGNRAIFESLGYRFVGEAPGAAVLLEKGDGIERWKARLRALALASSAAAPRGPISALVMNCNPFTLGHLHLVQAAAAASSRVFLFVVAEEASSFPFDVRFALVREGTAGIPGLTVVPGSEYLVSRATFPTYFLKDRVGDAARIHARLDVDLFGRHIAPAVGATRRFIGEEPYSEVTALYNRVMKDCLPTYGIEVVEIPRLTARGGEAVSASTLRRLIREGRMPEARDLVPQTTWEYLVSEEAAPILARIAASKTRH